MVSDLVIRYFKSEDAQKCSSLMQKHYYNNAINLPLEVRMRIANGRTTEYVNRIVTNRTIVVATIKDEVVGMGGLKRNEIRHMYIHSGYQRRGVGSAILNFIEKDAYYKGFSSLIVYSVNNSEEFYIKNGFRSLIKTQIERHGSILDAIMLEKIIE